MTEHTNSVARSDPPPGDGHWATASEKWPESTTIALLPDNTNGADRDEIDPDILGHLWFKPL